MYLAHVQFTTSRSRIPGSVPTAHTNHLALLLEDKDIWMVLVTQVS